MADKYFRLVCFVVNICPQLLREFFIKLAKCDAGTSYSNICSYISKRHGDVIELKRRKKIREDQFNLLYPRHGTADVNKWDVTLLITLITEMFPASLKPIEMISIDEIRTIRNKLQHLSNTSNMSDKDFDSYWDRLDSATMTLAKHTLSVTSEAEFRKKIDNANTSHLPDLGDALRLWYEETIREMADTINEMADTINDMKHKLDKIESDTTENTSILRQVTVAKSGHAGDKHKRFKTVDNILVQLQAGFETTMKELPDSFNAPVEENDIRTKLRDNHYVVVTGSYNSRYFETALAAIKGMDYNYKRSVEMHKSSDWRHIDPEDVDFVLCRDPFGSGSYDKSKAKGMADIFNSMMHTTKGAENKTIDLVIVTDLTILTECKKYHDHDILEEIVKVFDDTSESRPADLTLGCRNKNMTSNCFPVANNLGVLTSNFLKQYGISSSRVNESVMKEARDKFKAKKAIVLTGPRKCGKTSVAVALASSYQPSQCSLLTEPSDLKKIDFQNICLIIIDEFAGKYCYDEKNVYKWYSMFDHLYNVISEGQMNVIITCEKSKLDKCCDEISPHPVLEHRVSLSERALTIKQKKLQSTEPVTGPLSQIHGHQRVTQASSQSEQRLTGQHIWSVKDKHRSNIRINDDKCKCDIRGCCLLPSGEILLADLGNDRLKKLDDRHQVLSVCKMQYPYGVCYIGDNVAVVALFSKKLQFVDIRGGRAGMTLTRYVNTNHSCYGLAYGNNQLYVISKAVYIYSKDGIKQNIIYTSEFPFGSIALSDDGSLIYLTHTNNVLVTISSSGNHLCRLTHSELGKESGLCVDGEGHVLVYCNVSDKIVQLSSDGTKKLGIISHGFDVTCVSRTLCFDTKNTTLVIAGYDDDIIVLKLQ